MNYCAPRSLFSSLLGTALILQGVLVPVNAESRLSALESPESHLLGLDLQPVLGSSRERALHFRREQNSAGSLRDEGSGGSGSPERASTDTPAGRSYIERQLNGALQMAGERLSGVFSNKQQFSSVLKGIKDGDVDLRERLLLTGQEHTQLMLDAALDRFEQRFKRQSRVLHDLELSYRAPFAGREGLFHANATLALWENSGNLLFGQGGLVVRDGEEGANIGLGYRFMAGPDLLLGANTFYDYLSDPGVERWSLGAEARSSWLDLHGNWYQGRGSDRDGDIRYYSPDGWDVELAAHLPQAPWVELGASYYLWDGEGGQDDLEGQRYRLSLKPSTLLSMGFEYDDPDEGDGSWGVEFGFNYQFGVSLSRQLDFIGQGTPDLWSRRYEKVEREYAIRVREQRTAAVVRADRISIDFAQLIAGPVTVPVRLPADRFYELPPPPATDYFTVAEDLPGAITFTAARDSETEATLTLSYTRPTPPPTTNPSGTIRITVLDTGLTGNDGDLSNQLTIDVLAAAPTTARPLIGRPAPLRMAGCSADACVVPASGAGVPLPALQLPITPVEASTCATCQVSLAFDLEFGGTAVYGVDYTVDALTLTPTRDPAVSPATDPPTPPATASDTFEVNLTSLSTHYLNVMLTLTPDTDTEREEIQLVYVDEDGSRGNPQTVLTLEPAGTRLPSASVAITPLTESSLVAGTATAAVTLIDSEYVESGALDAADFTLTADVPGTVTVAGVTRTNATVATLTLRHEGADISVNGTLNVIVEASAHTGAVALYAAGSVPITAMSGDATLSGLTVTPGTLTPPFAAATTGYTLNVASTVTDVMLTATAADTGATLSVSGSTVASGSVTTISSLTEGGTRVVPIVVTAEDGRPMTYRVTITNAPDLMPTFGSQTVAAQSYTLGVNVGTVQLPAATGGDGALSYTLTPVLPNGLSFDANTRQISGTPTATVAATPYTLTATDTDATDPDQATLSFPITVSVAGPLAAVLTASPALTEANLDGATVRVTLMNTLYAASLNASGFMLSENVAGDVTVSGVVRDSDTVATLTLAHDGTDLSADGTLGVTVLAAAHASSGNLVTGTVSITSRDDIAPMLSTATVNRDMLMLVYDEALNETPLPDSGDYTVMVGGSAGPAVSGVAINDRTVLLTLASMVTSAQGVTLDYTPGSNPVEDVNGNDVAALDDRVVTNNTLPFVIGVTLTSDPGADETYAIGEIIEATLTFNENVTVVGIPSIAIGVGAPDLDALFAAGSGTTQLAFRYTVGEGNADTDGVSISANSYLSRGGTIQGATGVNADLVATPGLPDQSGHRVDGVRPVLDSATVDGDMLVLTYNKALDTASTPANGAYTVEVDSSTGPAVNDVTISGMAVTLTLATAVTGGRPVALDYTPGATPVQDAVGNDAVMLDEQTVMNNTAVAMPTISIAAGTSPVTEGTAATFTLTATPAPAGNLTVTVTVTDSGNFIAGAAPTTVTIAASATEATLTVLTMADSIDEENGMITAMVTTGAGYMVGTGNTASVTVNDDDALPMLAIDSPSVAEGDAGSTTLSYTVTLTGATEQEVTVDYADTTSGTATSGTDYEAVTADTLTFAPGTTTQNIDVTVMGDADDEGDGETVILRLSGETNATITTADGTGTITDDDDTVGGTVTVGLNADIAGDDEVNIAERMAGFTIGGTVDAGATVEVTLDGGTPRGTTETGTTWTLDIPADDTEITGTSVVVEATATLLGATGTVSRMIDVDLVAPTATYAAPPTLTVGTPITDIMPGGASADIASYAVQSGDIPPGLTLATDTGVISGTPTTANVSTADVTIRLTDGAGNTGDVTIDFPAVGIGSQTLSGFAYSADTATVGQPAPTVTAPSGAQTPLTYSSSTSAVCTVDTDTGALTLVGAGDCVITVTASATTNYNEATADFTITVAAAGAAGVTVTPATLSVPEDGSSTADYTLVLNTAPTADVTIAVASSDTLAATVSSATLTFSTTDWNTAQTVTVTGVSDTAPGDRIVTVTHAPTSTDTTYNSVSIDSVTVTVEDDDAVAPSATLAAADPTTLGARRLNSSTNRATVTVTLMNTVYEPSADLTAADFMLSDTVDGNVTVESVSRNSDTEATLALAHSGAISNDGTVSVTVLDSAHTGSGDLDAGSLPIDATAPTVVANGVAFSTTGPYGLGDNIEVTITFSEDVFVEGTTPNANLDNIGGRFRVATPYFSGNGSNTLVFRYTVVPNDDSASGVNIRGVTLLSGGGIIRDAAGNDVVRLNTNNQITGGITQRVDATLPMLSTATVDGTALTLTYDEALDDTSTPANGDYTVTVDTAPRDVSGVAISGMTVTLTLASAVTGGQTVILNYTPGTNPVQDTAGNNAAALSNRGVSTTGGTVSVTLGTIAGDNVVNIAEQAAGFTISGTVADGGTVEVTFAGGTPRGTTETGTTWTLDIPANDPEITGTSVVVEATAMLAGASGTVTRPLTVDLAAPTATYAAPGTLTVGTPIIDIMPGGASADIVSYAVQSGDIPPGLTLATDTGVISGIPTAANVSTADVTIRLTDGAGNTGDVTIDFPMVAMGSQTLDGFAYSAGTATVGQSAPTVTAPSGAQTPLTYSSSTSAVCTVDTDTGALTLVGAGDCVITVTASATANYNEATADFTITVSAAAAGVTVTPVTLSVPEDGGEGTYTLVLDTAPTADVTIAVASDTDTAATVSSASLTFTPTNWDTAQTVTVTGVNDDVDNPSDERTATVSHTAASADGDYSGGAISIASVTVTVDDDDTADVTVSETTRTVAEDGGMDTYTVVLDTVPLGNVTITPASSDTDVAIVSAALTFTSTTWDTAQTVTVTGVNDLIVNTTDRTATVSHTPASPDDSIYAAVTIPSVVVTATDDDAAVAAPTVSTVEISTMGPYGVDGVIDVTVTFSEVVIVTGTPQITLTVGTTPRQAAYISGTGTAALVFTYTVVDGDIDTDGVDIAPNVLAQAGGSTIQNSAGNDAALNHNAVVAVMVQRVQLGLMSDPSARVIAPVLLTESNLNGATLEVRLTGTGYVTNLEEGNFTLSLTGVAGVTVGSVIRDTTTRATLMLDYDDTAIDVDDSMLGVMVLAAGHTGSDILDAGAVPIINEAPSTDATLASLMVFDNNTPEPVERRLTPDFDPTVTDYTITVERAVLSVLVRPTVTHRRARFTRDIPGSSSVVEQITLNPDATLRVTINVTAEDGSSTETYRVDITRLPSSPVLESLSVNGDTLTLRYSLPLDESPQPSAMDFTVQADDSPVDIDEVLVDNQEVTLTLATAVTFDQTVTLSYMPGANPLQGPGPDNAPAIRLVTGDEPVSTLTNEVVMNDTPAPAVAPVLVGAEAEGTAPGDLAVLILIFDALLHADEESTPELSDFVVRRGGATGTVLPLPAFGNVELRNDPMADEGNVRLLFIGAVSGDYTVSYTPSGTRRLRGQAPGDPNAPGAEVAALVNMAITATGPTVALGVSTVAISSTGPYGVDGVIEVTVIFSEVVTVDTAGGTPQIPLMVGANPRQAVYTSGSTTAALVFTYTVVAGETDADGVSITANTLSENGGTIQNAGGTDAVLVHLAVAPNTAHAVNTSIVASPSITIAADTSSVTEGTAAAFTLTASPPAPVGGLTVTVSVSQTGTFIEGTPPTTVTIAAAATTAPLTVATTDDNIDEAAGSVTAMVTAGAGYTVGSDDTASITVDDDDTAGITVDPLALTVDEAGSDTTADYTVVLDTMPTDDVTIAVASDTDTAATVSSASLTFTPTNWNTAQTVTVTGVNDDVPGDRTATVTHTATSTDGNYEGAAISIASVTVIVNDDDAVAAGVTVDPVTLSVPEDGGTTADYTLVLDTAPTADVTIAVASDTVTAATVSSASLTFTPTNWNTAQTVTVTGVNDDVDNPSDERTASLIHTATSADGDYEGVAITIASVTVTVDDDDDAGVTVDPLALTVDEAGSGTTADYTLVLDTAPTADVTIAVASDTDTAATISSASLTFTPTDWDTAQTVTVTGVNDDVPGDRTATVSHTAASTDGNYEGVAISIASVTVTVTDDDAAAAGVTVTPETLSVPEDGGTTADYTLVLDTAPTADVTIAVASDTDTAATVSSASLTFTTTDWNTAQTVTVTGVNDDVPGDRTATVTHVPTSTDTTYNLVSIASVTVTVEDDDGLAARVIAPVLLTESNLNGAMLVVTLTGTEYVGESELGVDDFTLSLTGVTGVTVGSVSRDTTTRATLMLDYGETPIDVDDSMLGVMVLAAAHTDSGILDAGAVPIINEPTSSDATLASLMVFDGNRPPVARALAPAFDGSMPATTYAVTVESSVIRVMVTPMMNHPRATFTVDTFDAIGGAQTNVNPASITLNTGEPLTVTINMVAEDASAETYTVVITRLPQTAEFEGARVNGANLILEFRERGLDRSSTPSTQDFTVRVDSAEVDVGSVAITDDRVVTLVLETAVTPGQTVTLSYTPGTSPLLSSAGDPAIKLVPGGSPVSTLTDEMVMNETPPPAVAPVLVRAEATGTAPGSFGELILIFDAPLHLRAESRPSVDDFVVRRGSATGTVLPVLGTVALENDSVTNVGNVRLLFLGAVSGDYTVSYTPSGTTRLRGQAPGDPNMAGAEVAALVNVAITATGPAVALGVSTVAISSTGPYGVDGVIEVRVTFSEVVTVDTTGGTPQIPLIVGANTRQAVYTSGSTTAALVFTYTVVAGETDADGVSIAANTLSRNGGTIQNAGGTEAVLDHLAVAPNTAQAVDTGVVASPSITIAADTSPVTEGTAAAFTLTASPPAPVGGLTVTVSVSQTGTFIEGVAPTTVTIAAAATTAALMVDTTDDDIDEAAGSVTATVTAGAGYTVGTGNTASVTVDDDDTAGVTVDPLALTVDEAGSGTTADYTVVLDTAPTADVTIAVASDTVTAATVSSASLTFTPTNWNTAQTVTVTGVNDDIPGDRTATVTHTATSTDGNYEGAAISIASVTVIVNDDDAVAAGVTVDPVTLSVPEDGGTTADYTLVLDTAPTADVTIAVASDTVTAATVSSASLTFTPTNWNTAQTVTVTGVNDDVDNPSDERTASLIHTATSADGDYEGVAITIASVTVTVDDDDDAGVTVDPLALTVDEAGSGTTADYTLVLDTAPTADVTIAVASDTDTAATISSASLTFTPTDWDTAQTVTVTGVNDDVPGDRTATVSHTAASTDGNYEGVAISIASVTVTVTDDDAAAAGVTVTPETLSVPEDGGTTADYTLVLDTAPTADVTIAVASDTDTAATVSSASLTFTTTDWNTAQTVTVTGVNDDVPGDRTATVTHVPTSTDTTYNLVSIASVTVTVEDDDGLAARVIAPVLLTESNLNGAMLVVTLTGTEYVGESELGVDDFTLSLTGVTGVTVGSVSRDTTTRATLMLDYGETPIDVDDSMLGVMVLAAAHTDSGILDAGAVPIINEPTSSDATLASLMVFDGNRPPVARALAPAFDGSMPATTYAVTVESSVIRVMVTPMMNHPRATFTVDTFDAIGGAQTNVNPASITLNTGEPLTVTINMVAEDASAETYTVVITRLPQTAEFEGARVNGANLILEFRERGLDRSSTPSTQDFTVRVDSAEVDVGSVAITDDRVVTLVLETAVTPGQTVTLSYTPGTSPLLSSAGDPAIKLVPGGSPVSTLTDEMVMNETPPPAVAPVFDRAEATGTAPGSFGELILIFDAPLHLRAESRPSVDDFVVRRGSATGTVLPVLGTVALENDSVTNEGSVRLLFLGAVSGDYTVSYTPSGTTRLRGQAPGDPNMAGAEVAALVNVAITATGPTVALGVSTVAISSTGPYGVDGVIEVTVIFSEVVTVDTAGGTPQIPLMVGANPRQAVYTSGSTTAALVFTYTVVAGETDADGVSITANTLSENGGTIQNAGGTDAVLVHLAVAPDTAHVVDTGIVASPSITIAADTSPVTEGTAAAFTLTASPPAPVGGLTVTVSVSQTGTFIEGVAPTTVTIAAAATTAALMVDTTDDDIDEAAGSVTATVTAGAGYTVGTGDTASVTVNDDDAEPTLAIDSPSVAEGDAGDTPTLSYTVTLTGDTEQEVTVDYVDATSGSATSGTDYTAITGGTLTFAPGTTTQNIDVTVMGDADDEGDETVILRLSGETNATITTADGTGTITDDDGAPVVAPTVSTVEISSTGPYALDEDIEVTVTFSEAVTVDTTGGTPQIPLVVGVNTRQAAYTSGSTTAALVFTYTVVAAETDADGVSIVENTLSENGGTIQNSDSTDANLDHPAVAPDTAHAVDTTAPAVSMVEISSTGPYALDEDIEVTVTFSEAVTVSGTPEIILMLGASTSRVTFSSGSGSTALVFTYTVQAGDSDDNGVGIAANVLAQAGGSTIQDAVGNNATLTHTAVDEAPANAVDTTAPTVSMVEISSDGPYGVDGVIEVTVTFSEAVTVSGTPEIILMLGASTSRVTFSSGSGSTALVFTYTVQAGDSDDNGVGIAANVLAQAGGSTIQDAVGNNATLTHTAVDEAPANAVDTTAPTVSMVEISSDGPYGVDGVIEVTVTFSEAVTVSGTPEITLTVGTTPRSTTAVSGSGSDTLVFMYTVVAEDSDDDGVSIAANALALNSGAIRDAAGNDAALAHDAVAAALDQLVDGTMTSGASAQLIPSVLFAVLTESNLNGATLVVALTGTGYVGDTELGADDFMLSLTGVAGVTVGSVIRNTTTRATLMLAYDETPIDVDDSMLGVMVLADGHTGSGILDAGSVSITNEAPSSDATLANLMVLDDSGVARALKPAFDPTVTDYTIRVERAVLFVLVRPVTHRRTGFTLDVDTLIDQPERINLNPDVPRMVTINVTAEDGSSTGTYSVTLTRLPSAPVLESLSVNGDTLTLRYSRALDTGSQPSTTDFTVQADGGTVNIDSVVVAGATVTLTLATAVTDDQTVTLSYIPGANPVQDSISGRTAIQLVPGDEPVTTLTDEMVTNDTPPPAVAPVFRRATVELAGGSFGSFFLVFDAPLAIGSGAPAPAPSTSTFTITRTDDGTGFGVVGGIARSNNSITGEGTVTVTFGPGFMLGGVEYSITYTPPSDNPLAGQAPGNIGFPGALVEGFTATAQSP